MNREDHIRHIIETFYEGASTPAQNREIEDYFKNHSADIPADLREERDFFLTIGLLESDIPEMPETLTDDILSSIRAENLKTSMRRRKVMTTAAAAVMLIILSVAGIVRISQGKPLSISESVAMQESTSDSSQDNSSTSIPSSKTPIAAQHVASLEEPTSTYTSAREEIIKPQRRNRKGIKSSISVAVVSSDQNMNGMRVVEDPEEARYITQKAMHLLSKNLKTGRKAVAATDEMMKKNVNITHNILEDNI